MPMVRHQAITENTHVNSLERLGEHALKGGVVGPVPEQGPPRIAPVERVVDQPANVNPLGPSHARQITPHPLCLSPKKGS